MISPIYKVSDDWKHKHNGEFSIYRNVIVFWDTDNDTRIFTLLDELPAKHVSELLAVMETEGTVHMQWKDYPPISFPPEIEVEEDGMKDSWVVDFTRLLDKTGNART